MKALYEVIDGRKVFNPIEDDVLFALELDVQQDGVRLGNMIGTLCARLREAERDRDRLRAMGEKVNEVRKSIVGMQGFNFSEHAYPLVAALDEAGFDGGSYQLNAKNLGTLIEQTKAAEQVAEKLGEACEVFKARIVDLEQQLAASRKLNMQLTQADAVNSLRLHIGPLAVKLREGINEILKKLEV